jgi:hypothetical protein
MALEISAEEGGLLELSPNDDLDGEVILGANGDKWKCSSPTFKFIGFSGTS